MTIDAPAGFRLIVDEPGDGQRNMAVDEALLAHAAEAGPTIRLYGFRPPTLSVGRLQPLRPGPGAPGLLGPEGLQRLRDEGITLVRRPTGGQAVLHDRELTYAVVLGRSHVRPFAKREIYRFVASLLVRGLLLLGIAGQPSRDRRGGLRQPDCFQATGEYEIASAAQRKLIGSAQLLTRDASLQHGAIPLDGSYRRIAAYLRGPQEGPGPESAEPHAQPSSIAEELGRAVSFPEAVEAFSRGFAEALREHGAQLRPGALTAAERAAAEELRAGRYSQESWNLLC